MKIIISFFLFALLLCFNAEARADEIVTVSSVIDGDTFITKKGYHIRLLHINTPEIGHNGKRSQPFSQKAKLRLKKLIEGKKVTIRFGTKKHDRYKRLLAHVYKNKVWINKALVKAGLAHVYTFPDNRGNEIAQLKEAEQQARNDNLGIWSTARWTVRNSDKLEDDKLIGKFQLIKGKVQHVVEIKGVTYINFGTNWRTDFTVEIPKKFKKFFTRSDINPKEYYQGKLLLVRGVLKPVNGTLITATHPEQLTISSE